MKREKVNTEVAADVTLELLDWCVRIMHCSGVQLPNVFSTPVGWRPWPAPFMLGIPGCFNNVP